MSQYKVILDQAEQLLGKEAHDTIAPDRMLIGHWDLVSKALRDNPQKFNSPLGFEAVVDLDDASRNAALLANLAQTRALKDITSGTIAQTSLILSLSQNSTDTGTLLYTVSENGASLYKKYLAWQGEASRQALDMVEKCQVVLKELAVRKKQ